jgi:pimeloyl-ACP methyl ester carboxylesterase
MRPPIGQTVTGEGHPVLLLHGLGADHTQALALLSDSVPATRIAADMPGHGDTDLLDDEPVTFAAFADLAAAVLDSLHRNRALPPVPSRSSVSRWAPASP